MPLAVPHIAVGLRGGSSPPSANMAAWFRKGTGISSSSGAVSNWADQSGNGRDLVQATSTAQPALQADGTILFDGTSDNLRTATFTLPTPCTIYLRFKQVTWNLNGYVCDGFSGNSGALRQQTATPNLQIFAGSAAAENSAMAVGVWASVGVVFNGGSSVIDIGGSITTGNPGAAGPAGFTLGSSGGGTGQYCNIQVAEAIIYNVAHSASQRTSIFSYMNQL